MKPSISIDRLKFESKVIYSKVNVDVSYKIKMPIRLLGQDEFTNISYATHTDVRYLMCGVYPDCRFRRGSCTEIYKS